MSIDKRLISTGAAAGCTTDTLDIFGDSSCVALYGLNYDGSDAGGNYDGTPTDVTFNAPGYIDYAASFNGSSSGIDLPNLGISGSQSRTVSFWFNLNATPSGTEQLYSQGTNNLKEAFNIQLTSSAKVQVSYAGREWDSTTALSTGQWYHILVTYNGGNIETSLNTEIYINGTEETLVSGGGSSTGIASTSNTSYSLGYRTNISTLYVDGKMDQVRIFNKALSAAEVTTLYGELACEYTCTTDTNGFPASASSDLVAYYKLDNDATDETGSYNGTASNVTFDGGRYGLSASFNGSSSYISTTYIVPASNTASISSWFNISSTGNYRTLFSDAPSNGAAINTRMQIYFTPTNTFDVIIGNNSGYWVGSSNSIASYIDGNWHNLIATYNGTDVKVYIDGSLFQSFTSTISFGTAGNQSLVLGKAGLNNVNYWLGKIDQVRIYDKALSSTEVSSLYEDEHQCYITVDSTDPFGDSNNIALYEFENNANDSTGSYNGTASNVTYSTDSIIGTYSASFNGSSSNITTSMASSNFGTGGAASFSWWWKPNTSGTTVHFLFEGDVESTYSVHTGGGAGTLGIRVSTKNTSGTTTFLDIANAYTTGIWQHHTVTIGGGETKLYKDGSLIGSTTYSGTLESCNSFQIGKRSTSYYYNGLMDQFRIFSKVLNGDEVWKLYAEGAKG